jgi:hypothetical protein
LTSHGPIFPQFSILICADTIDKEKKMKHSKLAERMEEAITDPSKINVKLRVGGAH